MLTTNGKYNGHHDVTKLVSDSGQVLASYYYDSFGNVTEKTGETDNPYTYSGYFYDQEVNLYYMNSRFYDARIARFMTEDTYFGDPADALSLNLYTYCSNNPLVYWDPSGHKPIKINLKDSISKLHPDYQFVQDHGYFPQKLDDLVTSAKGTVTRNGNKKSPDSLTIQVGNSIVELYKSEGSFFTGNYYGLTVKAAIDEDGVLHAADGVHQFLKDSDDIKQEYIKETGFLDKMADHRVSVYIEPELSETALTYVREAVAGQNGSLDLGAVSGWQNQGQAKAINGAIRKLTGVHGDPNLGVDNYLLTGLETIGVKNNYRPSASYVIDDQMYGFIRDMAHDIQNEIDTADGFNWRKWNEETIAERAIMADTVTNAAYLTAIHMNMQSYQNNPENFNRTNTGNLNGSNSKTLYRGERSSIAPEKAFKEGLVPKGTGNDLLAHTSSNTTPGNFISTSSDIGIAEGFAGKNGYIYEINSSNYIDVNSTLGASSPHSYQMEYSIPGGVAPSQIKGAWVVRGGLQTGEYIPNPGYTGGK